MSLILVALFRKCAATGKTSLRSDSIAARFQGSLFLIDEKLPRSGKHLSKLRFVHLFHWVKNDMVPRPREVVAITRIANAYSFSCIRSALHNVPAVVMDPAMI